jgi:hypothetical protein
MRFGPRQGHDLVGRHANVGAAAESFDDPPSSGVVAGLAYAGVVFAQLELDFRMRQKAQAHTDLLWNRDLSFAGNLHGNTPTGKSSAVAERLQRHG